MLKRSFDFVVSFIFLALFSWLLIILILVAAVATRSSGVFLQERVGRYGQPFKIIKICTVYIPPNNGRHEIGPTSAFLRRSKLNEFPQLINILKGDMSLVGPRPDIRGYYDRLIGEERKILGLRPGLTSEASIKYFNEEALLLQQDDPKAYNDDVIFPDKVKMNLEYYYTRSFYGDLSIIWKTIFKN